MSNLTCSTVPSFCRYRFEADELSEKSQRISHENIWGHNYKILQHDWSIYPIQNETKIVGWAEDTYWILEFKDKTTHSYVTPTLHL